MRTTSRLIAITLLVFSAFAVRSRTASPTEIVIYASDVTTVAGAWKKISDPTAAGGTKLGTDDTGAPTVGGPQVSPTDYFEATFDASAATRYRLWLRVHAKADSKWNDSVYVQLSDSVDGHGSPVYRIGSDTGYIVNLWPCSECQSFGWGWQRNAYWLADAGDVWFAASGTHTLRVQTREDGVEIDQVVISAAQFADNPPGPVTGDSTIVPKPVTPPPPPPPPPPSGSTPFTGTPVAIPGMIRASNFDNGGEGVAYHDTTSGNSGGAYRDTDVDLEESSEGGYDVGWIAAGEWLAYTVDVAGAGSYIATFRIAAPIGGGTFHLEMNGADVTGPLSIPTTGDWQLWQDVGHTVTLSAGRQIARVVMDAPRPGGSSVGNIISVTFSSSSSGTTSTPFNGVAAVVPGTVQAENFDDGGEGIAYHDSGAGNEGGAYRATDVDIEPTSVGYDVGWIASGEWLKYTVDVSSTGRYVASFKVAVEGQGGAFHLDIDGANATGSLIIPDTGGWQNWRSIDTTVTLNAGRHVLRLAMETEGDFAVGNFDRIDFSPAPPVSTGSASMLTQHNDNRRSGANLLETTLTTSSVSSGRFGLLFSLAVDGYVYAQPLYVPRVSTAAGVRNLVYVATEHNSVYAFDADAAAAPIWRTNIGPSISQDPANDPDGALIQDCFNLTPEIGITSTPVVDPARGLIYALGKTRDSQGVVRQKLVALDLATGAVRNTRDVQASVSVNGATLAFDPALHLNRAALTLANGIVYAGFGSHCDIGDAHGWILGFDGGTLAPTTTFLTTPTGALGAVWQGAQGLTVDENGALYVMTGNGTYWSDTGDFGDTVLKLQPSGGTLAITDWFTPHNAWEMEATDGDLGSAGLLMIPGTSFLLGGGKEGRLYLVDADQMGRFDANTDRVRQSIQVTDVRFYNNIHGAPVYWNSPAGGRIYLWGENEPMKVFGFNGSQLTSGPIAAGNVWAPTDAMPGGFLSLSANDRAPGSGIIWAAIARDRDATNQTADGVLRAFDAEDITREIWNSDLDPADNVGGFAKFAAPTIVNGKVYVGTFSGAVRVYGLKP